ncbi:MAG TPA: DPP IV N-terminal domain-containing protein, partial [Chitinophagaceae bacterium]|nr:DPP IV N-terminal domain-containing protein [Chitinophagaceae bacterium]
MQKTGIATLLLLLSFTSFSQGPSKLTVEKIMRDPKWIGTSPSGTFWSQDGTKLYFLWNPEKAPSDSLYYITITNKTPVKATVAEKQVLNAQGNPNYNLSRTQQVYVKDGDIFYTDIKTGKIKRITQTVDVESNPQFSFNETKIVYSRNQNLYAWDIMNGETIQLTNTKASDGGGSTGGGARGAAGSTGSGNQQENWLKNDQLQYFQVLKERKEKREAGEAYTKNLPKEKELRTISLEDKTLQGLGVSPDGRFVSYRL